MLNSVFKKNKNRLKFDEKYQKFGAKIEDKNMDEKFNENSENRHFHELKPEETKRKIMPDDVNIKKEVIDEFPDNLERKFKNEASEKIARCKEKSLQTIIYEHQKEVSQNIPAKFTPHVPISNERLQDMKSRSIDTRTMMGITDDEVEHLILNNQCQPVLNRKNDIGLEFPCKFCDWYHKNFNVPIRSFQRKEEIKRHHMLHLNHDRHSCQLCDYKCVRADHLRRHMRNKHPSVSYCHKSKTILPMKRPVS